MPRPSAGTNMGKRARVKRKEEKLAKLKKLASHLTALEPGIRDSFMCPVCLDVIPLTDLQEISEAHVVPKAAGGLSTTFLCKTRCNSTFGSRQDKWFGEHTRLIRSDIPSLFNSNIQPKTFTIDGVPVHGHISEDSETVHFRFDIHRNSPATNRLIKEKFANRPHSVTFDVPFPLLAQERLTKIGYLTAAYLRWFEAFGYSWVLQSYLAPVRDQIRNPDRDIFEPTIPKSEGAGWRGDGWLGIVSKGNDRWLGYGLNDWIVCFPPVDQRDVQMEKADDLKVKIHQLRDFLPPEFPNGLVFDNRALIAPDSMLLGKSPLILSYHGSDGAPPQLMSPVVSDERWNELVQEPGSVVHRIVLK